MVKSKIEICKERKLQAKEFAANGISNEWEWNFHGMDLFSGYTR